MSTAFTGAHLITGDGRDYADATVKVEGNRIVEVETNGGALSADRYVDLAGRTFIPGLIDVHVHLIGGDKAIGFGDEATTFRMYEPVPKALLDGARGCPGRRFTPATRRFARSLRVSTSTSSFAMLSGRARSTVRGCSRPAPAST